MSSSSATGAGKSGGMEVFPDLHHKMSKKIAQLTKVIYHLNTKNEDHALEVEQINANHQLEIQQILRDAAGRISKFKEAIEQKQQNAGQDKALEKLQKKLEQEKAAAQQELSALKAKFSEREMKVSQEFQAKYESTRKEIETMNGKFLEKLQAFEALNASLKQSLEQAQSNSKSGSEELRAKYEKEIADLVKSSNEQYQKMIVEQLGIQESLKKEHEVKLSMERNTLTAKFQTDLDKELGQLRAKLNAEKQEALLALKREMEERMNAQKIELTSRIEQLLKDMRGARDEHESDMTASAKTIKGLEEKIAAMERSMKDQQGGSAAQIGNLSQELSHMKDANNSLQAKLTVREEELETLQRLLTEKSGVLASTEVRLENAEAEIKRLRMDLEATSQSGSEKEKELRARLQQSESESASFRAEINTIGSQLAASREELKQSKEQAQKAQLEADQKLAALAAEKAGLLKQIAEMQQSTAALSNSSTSEISLLKKQLADLDESSRSEKLKLIETNQRVIDQLKDSHRSELDALLREKLALSESSSSKEQQMLADIAHQRNVYEDRLQAMTNEHKKLLEETLAHHAEEVSSLKSAMSELEAQLHAQSEANETEKNSMKAEISKLDGKYKNVLKELDAKKKESERTEAVTNGLKNQIENLREELKASQKAFREKMDISTAKLEADWAQKLEQEIERLEAEKRAQAYDMQKLFESEKASLLEQHAEEIKTLKSLLQKEAQDSASSLADSERARESLEALLKQEKAARATQVNELNTSHAAAMRSSEEAHRAEIDRLKRDLKSSAEGREQQMTQAHQSEIDRLNETIERNKLEASQQLAATTQALQLSSEESLRKALQALEDKLLQEKRGALEAQKADFVEETAKLSAKLGHEKELVLQELSDTVKQRDDALGQSAALQRTIEEERKARQRREEEFVIERDQINRDCQNDIRKEKELSERKVSDVLSRAEADSRALQAEHQERCSKYEERLREVAREYRVLEERYRNRESRSEDIARIQQLEAEIVDKDELVAKTREEMLYFKREMLNREENYNSKFSRQPNVGVMQVIKPKEPETAPTGRAKPTQMRVINPQGGNMIPGVGAMGPMGVGGVGGGMGMAVGAAPPPGSGGSKEPGSLKASRSAK